MTESALIVLAGELDHGSADALRARLAQAGMAFEGEELTLDLSGVTFIDSTGLGVLVGATRSSRSAGGDVRLIGCRPSMRHVLNIAGLDRFFTLAEERREVAVG